MDETEGVKPCPKCGGNKIMPVITGFPSEDIKFALTCCTWNNGKQCQHTGPTVGANLLASIKIQPPGVIGHLFEEAKKLWNEQQTEQKG